MFGWIDPQTVFWALVQITFGFAVGYWLRGRRRRRP